jgi:hypothetical protein
MVKKNPPTTFFVFGLQLLYCLTKTLFQKSEHIQNGVI